MAAHDLSGVVFRGERDGALREQDGWLNPHFFAERFDQAALYAGRGTQPIACVIRGQRLLDLTVPDIRNKDHAALCQLLMAEHDEWICRRSGEPRNVLSFLEAGDLYDYEGTGSGTRWKSLFRLALDELGFDAVRIMDATDGTNGEPTPVWVTQRRENIRHATFGEELVARLGAQPWHDVERWIENKDPSLMERVRRLCRSDEEYRLDQITAPEVLDQLNGASKVSVFRALPAGSQIRPGDCVSLNGDYARQHLRGDSVEIASLALVDIDDVFWAGTDENEFFYLPKAWRLDGLRAEELLRSLGPDALRMLCDGEMHRIAQHRRDIERINEHIYEQVFDEDACGIYHGPAHWTRVSEHGVAVARSMGIDPLVPHLFGLVHDSHREDEGMDPLHGRRSAAFVREMRDSLFHFLSDESVEDLAHACDLHSDGHTEGSAPVQACWDADRLDLWRVGIKPLPQYLCTAYAKRSSTIRSAHAHWARSSSLEHETPFERE